MAKNPASLSRDEKIARLGKKITDRATVLLGKDKITPEAPEYWGINSALKFIAAKNDQQMSDDCLDIMQTMPKRVPMTIEQLAKENPQFEREYLEKCMFAVSESGLVEYHWENLDGKNPNHEKRWVLDMFVPGSAEIMMIHPEHPEMFPETADFFERMTFLPLAGITELVPPGGAGIGMHVIPVEKAIPADCEAMDIERLSHWLKKYEGHIGVSVCSCRKQQRIRNEGDGEIEAEWCIGVGEFADYCRETGHGRDITVEEALEILKKAEDRGYVHQTTNIDGEEKVFGICNCALGICNALRTSQLFNTPNMSASAYTAVVDPEKCVACGKCAENCAAGAARLGQKLCTKDGPIEYPKAELPDDTKWGKDKWNWNFRENGRSNLSYETGTAPCKAACPAHIAIQGYIKMASEGRYKEALKLIKQDNPFPAICGSICHKYCESACTRASVDEPLSIDEIKKFIAEQDLKAEHHYVPEMNSSTRAPFEQKIAIIGAGPAGLSCAYFLALEGYKPVVFEKNATPGGMLMHGIPSFRLEKDVVNAEIEVLKEMGVEIRCGVEVGKDVTIQQLRDEGYKGFYIAIGAQKSSKIGVPGEELEGCFGGVEFLREANNGGKPAIGKRCVVVGGGNVAMDVARTAVRLGAETIVAYRRKESDMKADKEEIAAAKAEGVQFMFEYKPVEIRGENGKVCALVCEAGEIAADSVIAAVGQSIDWGGLDTGALVKNAKNGAEADGVTYQTAEPDIFVGGDVYTGPKFAIDAIAAGREGAESLHRFVNKGQSLTIHRNRHDYVELKKENVVLDAAQVKKPARAEVAIDVAKFCTMHDDRKTFTEEQIKTEASRCLSCGRSVVDPNKCIGCGICTTKCEFDAIHLVRNRPQNSTMIRAEDKFKAIIPYAAKREVKIIKKKLSGK
ncbi:MAG: FAD-dependent oxidoreductase [Oscillospiraceae bacterium]|nr:FAD-dependent oxidoreductase [Oscillospiraceae bacterium]